VTQHIQYDASIIKTFATRLYLKAQQLVQAATVLAGLFGLILGGAAGGAVEHGVLGALFGAVLGALIGYMSAQYMAFKLKLQAQIALCQVQIEENTRAAATASRQSPPATARAA
jgi:hypothetical protein